MRSNPAHHLLFIFQLENISRSYLNLSTSYGCSTDLESLLGLLLVSFIWLEEKNSLKHLLPDGRDVCPHMSKRCRHRLCPDWLSNFELRSLCKSQIFYLLKFELNKKCQNVNLYLNFIFIHEQ